MFKDLFVSRKIFLIFTLKNIFIFFNHDDNEMKEMVVT